MKAGTNTSGSTGAFGASANGLSLNSSGITLDLNGFNVGVGGLSGSGSATNSSGTTATLTAGNDNSSSAYSGALSGNLGLTKAGTGTLTLSGANTYTRATAVNAGTLLVTGSLASPVAVTVASGATFGGSGSASLALWVPGAPSAPGLGRPRPRRCPWELWCWGAGRRWRWSPGPAGRVRWRAPASCWAATRSPSRSGPTARWPTAPRIPGRSSPTATG